MLLTPNGFALHTRLGKAAVRRTEGEPAYRRFVCQTQHVAPNRYIRPWISDGLTLAREQILFGRVYSKRPESKGSDSTLGTP